jgi:hypothetical protein
VFGTNEDVQIVAKTESAESHCLVGKWQLRWNLGRNKEITGVLVYGPVFYLPLYQSDDTITHNLELTCIITSNQTNKQD